ncbi:MAG: hypothetical protein AMJ68_11055 [Acidithiobacillales bacterium SG8_45]|nr:MAG: hypothetical protein AMJ68_11055 [Acidithiobacillales bacterium SG8_45]
MPTSSLADTEWVDIVPPVAVTASPDVALVLLIVVAVLVAAMMATWFYSTQPKQQALRKLRPLIHAPGLNPDQRRDRCHLIAQQLGAAFGVTRLSAVCIDDARQERWQEFLQQLDQKRFSPEPPSGEDLAQLAAQAVNWLRPR